MANGVRGSQPSNLAQPEAGGDLEQQLLAQQQQPVAGPQGGGSLDDIFAEPAAAPVDAQAQQQQLPPALQPESLDEIFGPAQGEPAGFLERAQLSFATTDVERQQFLENSFGPENVKKDKKGNFLFRRSAEEGFQKIDPETFELFNDLLADNARLIFETGVDIAAGVTGAVVGGAGGAAAGTVAAPGVGTVGGGVAGAAAGAALGGVVATNAADLIAEEVIGIERDPERSRVQESLMAGALGGALGGVGRVASNVIRRSAKTADSLKAIPRGKSVEDQLPQVARQIQQDAADLSNAGLEIGIKGEDGEVVNVLLHNLDPKNPRIKEVTDAVKDTPEFFEAQAKLGDNIRDTVNTIIQGAGNVTPLGDDIVVNRKVTQRVDDLLTEVNSREGKIIGDFKKRAAKTFKDNPQPARRTSENIGEFFDSIGIKREGDELVVPDAEELASRLGLEGKNLQLNRFVKKLESIGEDLFNKGGLTPSEFEDAVRSIGKLNKSTTVRKNPELKVAVARISSALRADRNDAVRAALPEEMIPQFDQAMGKFATLKQSAEQVTELMKANKMSQQSFVRSIFNKGKEGLADIEAAKKVIQSEDPVLWRDLVGEFYDQIIFDVTNGGAKELSLARFNKKLNGFGREFVGKLQEDAPFTGDQLRKALRLGQRMEETNAKVVSNDALQELKRDAVNLLSPFRNARINSLQAILGRGFRNKDLAKALSTSGIDDVLQEVPLARRGRVKTMWNALLKFNDETFNNGSISFVRPAVSGVAREEAIGENR